MISAFYEKKHADVRQSNNITILHINKLPMNTSLLH